MHWTGAAVVDPAGAVKDEPRGSFENTLVETTLVLHPDKTNNKGILAKKCNWQCQREISDSKSCNAVIT
eukprot:3358404-Amphidinium_carterae.1